MSTQFDILIIGTGLAGYVTAMEIRKHRQDVSIALITESEGHFYSKPTLSTGFKMGKTADDLITHTAQAMMDQYQLQVYTHETVMDIDLEMQSVSSETGQRYDYKQLVLACGAVPLKLHQSIEGAQVAYAVNQWEDYAQLRADLSTQISQPIAIVGAGLVGVELACDLSAGGYPVTLIHADAWPVNRLLPEPIGQALSQGLTTIGVSWKGPDQLRSCTPLDQGVELQLASGDTVRAACMISAVGLAPRTQLAQSAGLAVKQGIVTDAYLRTNHPNVYALGDCAEVANWSLGYVAPLRRCAQALAKTLSGEPTAVTYPAMPIVLKTPCCPTVVVPPPPHVKGAWHFEGSGLDRLGCFESPQGEVLGFALTGSYLRERAALLSKIPAWLPQ